VKELTYIDLFAGCGGLSEGFIRAGFEPVAHVEMNKEACETLKTRVSYHFLKKQGQERLYYNYLEDQSLEARKKLWESIPKKLFDSIIQSEISAETIEGIFENIDKQIGKQKVKLIIGGPPCQAYSLIGRSRDPNRMLGDKRNYLFKYYAEFLKKYEPEFFVFENVLGLLTAGNSTYFKEMKILFKELGYAVDHKVFESEKFGVLQKRRRVILIGRKGTNEFKIPNFEDKENKEYKIIKDLFFDLPKLKPGQEIPVARYTESINKYLSETQTRNGIDFTTQHICRKHNDRDLEIYSLAIDKWQNEGKRLHYDEIPERLQTHKNKTSFADRYKVVDDNGFSHTMVAHIAKDGHYYIYPDKNQVRSISVREAARIQSFPDDYFFEGGRTAAFKQIGNAVPPLMAECIAKEIYKLCQ
jgi:DNA (cytosine-5)-methyltransferase 1